MAEVLKSFDFARKSQTKYDWADLLDGRIHRLTEEDLNGSKFKNMPGRIRFAAKKRGKSVRMSVDAKEGTIVFQAFVPGENGEVSPPKKGKEKAKKEKAKKEKAKKEKKPEAVAPAESTPEVNQ